MRILLANLFSPIVLLQREFYFPFLVIVLFIPENFKFSLNRIQLVPSSPISLIYIYINGRHGERRGKRSGCSPPPPPARMNKRQSVYRGIHADKSYRGSDRDACRENGGPNRDAATAPLPLPRAEVGSMDRFNAEFNVLCSVFERFGAIRGRGSRTNTPSSSNPRSRCPVPSLYPSIRPAPPSSSPPLSIRLPGLWTANTPGGSTHLRPNERPTEPTYPFCLPTYPSTYLSPLIHSLLSASGIPNW